MALAVIRGSAIVGDSTNVTITPAAGHTYNINLVFGNHDGTDYWSMGTSVASVPIGLCPNMRHIKVITDNSNPFFFRNDSAQVGGYNYTGWDKT